MLSCPTSDVHCPMSNVHCPMSNVHVRAASTSESTSHQPGPRSVRASRLVGAMQSDSEHPATEAAEDNSRVPIKLLLSCDDITPEVSRIVVDADENGDGFLSLDEVAQVFEQGASMVYSSNVVRGCASARCRTPVYQFRTISSFEIATERTLCRVVLVLCIGTLLMCGALVGVAFAASAMAKDTGVKNGVMVAAGGSDVVATGTF
jgi:hypothetical protein